MLGVDNVSEVVYRYLRALKVKVSRITVCHLLSIPSGQSIEGVGDALDSLHIKNMTYQLPTEFLNRLSTPFIASLETSDFSLCLVEKIEKDHVFITTPQATHLRISKQQFTYQWTGTILVGEPTQETFSERFVFLKNLDYKIRQHKILTAGLATIIAGILTAFYSNFFPELLFYILTLFAGILISSVILYKETINDLFLHRFCHVGNAIDCNEVLHSRKISIAGMRLSELSLIYFVTMFFFTIVCPKDFYTIGVLLCAISIAFTVYSIIYQLFIVHKGCMLCILTSITIWSNAYALYLMREDFSWNIPMFALLSFISVGCICILGWIIGKALLDTNKERIFIKRQLSHLLNPNKFQELLATKPQIEAMIGSDKAMCNDAKSKHHVMVVINPNCKECARVHFHIKDVPQSISLSVILATSINDRLGERIAQIILSAYLADGWLKAMKLLEEWYITHDIKEADKYNIGSDVLSLWKDQQNYCNKHHIAHTPSIIVNRHYMPNVYQFEELKYVLV